VAEFMNTPKGISNKDQPVDSELVLASASPRRRDLLGILVRSFGIRPADIDERQEAGEKPATYVRRLAEEKALAIAGNTSEGWVIGADTVVVLDGRCLGKPKDAGQAATMLRAVSGRTHQVYSAVTLIGSEHHRETALSVTEVRFDPLPDAWIEDYVKSGEPMDKAGAYAIQGGAAAWISGISGSYTGVVGLPLYETAGLLRAADLL